MDKISEELRNQIIDVTLRLFSDIRVFDAYGCITTEMAEAQEKMRLALREQNIIAILAHHVAYIRAIEGLSPPILKSRAIAESLAQFKRVINQVPFDE